MARSWRSRLSAVIALGVLMGMIVAPAQALATADPNLSPTAQPYKDACGDFRPTSGSFWATRAGGEFRVTWNFSLSSEAEAALDCVENQFGQEYLELELALTGFGGVDDWDGYEVTGTNIPGAVHDTGWADIAADATPGVTGIPVSALNANMSYYFSIRWNTTSQFYPIEGQVQRVSFQWVPSHWADPFNPFEGLACVAGLGLAAWCVFPGGTAFISGQYYDFFPAPDDGIPFGSPLSPPYFFPLGSNGSIGGSSGGSDPPGGSPPSRQLFLRGDSMLFAKDTLSNGGWMEESASGSISKIAVGGATQVVLNACNAVFARTTLGIDGWTQETPCGGAQQIAVSSTGLQVLLDANFAVWAKYGVGDGGWIRETDDYSATKIAVGGNTQMLIDPDGAVHAKTWLGYGGWVKEHTPQNPADKATAIAADNTGMQAFIRGDAAVFAKRGVGEGGWQQQAGPGNADAIAAGSGVLMFLRGDGAVFAKTNIAIDGGWLPQADPHTVTAIAMGNSGRMMIRSDKNAVFAKDNLVNGDWHLQVGDGNAAAIAVG